MSNDNTTHQNRKTNNTARTGYFITIELLTPKGVKDKCFTTVKDWESVQSFVTRIKAEFTILNLNISKLGVKE